MVYGYTTSGTEVAADCSEQIAGKVVLTTGVSPNGLGAEFVNTIAVQKPRLLILANRNLDKAAETAKAINAAAPSVEVRLLKLDLASQAAVREAAKEVLAYSEEAIDVLVLNAGIMAPPYSKTADGLESQFGANHIGHFLFTNLVLPKVLKAKDGGRVDGKAYDPWLGYGQSKTANMLFALALAEKLGRKGLVAMSVHPGVIQTNLAANSNSEFSSLIELGKQLGLVFAKVDFSKFPYKTPSQGVATHVRAAFDPTLKASNGRYMEDANVAPNETIRAWARDRWEAERLWKVSEEIVGQEFDW